MVVTSPMPSIVASPGYHGWTAPSPTTTGMTTLPMPGWFVPPVLPSPVPPVAPGVYPAYSFFPTTPIIKVRLPSHVLHRPQRRMVS